MSIDSKLKGKSVYIAGPVTDYADRNAIAFECGRRLAERLGAYAVVPLDHVPPQASHEQAMGICIRQLMRCSAILMLPMWEESEGARLEHDIAVAVGMPVYMIARYTHEPQQV